MGEESELIGTSAVRRRDRLGWRLTVTMGTLGGLLAVAAIAAVVVAYDHDRTIDELGELQDDATAAVHVLSTSLGEQESGMRGYVLTSDISFLDPYVVGRPRADEALDRLDAFAERGGDAELATAVTGLRALIADWHTAAAERMIDAVQRGDTDAAVALVRTGAGRDRFELIRTGVDDLTAVLTARAAVLDERLQRSSRLVATIAVGALLAGAALVGIGVFDLRRHGIRPVATVADAITDVASGRLDRRIPVVGSTEVRTVAAGAEAMRTRLLTEIDDAVRRGVLDAEQAERARLAGELHDDAVQALYASSLRLQAVAARERDRPDVADPILAVSSSLSALQDRLRTLMFVLAPASLDAVGLEAAIADLCDELFTGTPTHAEIDVFKQMPLDSTTRSLAFRIVAEALRNVAKHAEASTVRIEVAADAEGARATITDDGRGPDWTERATAPHGLSITQALAAAVGGWVTVSGEVGNGTTVRFWIPRQES